MCEGHSRKRVMRRSISLSLKSIICNGDGGEGYLVRAWRDYLVGDYLMQHSVLGVIYVIIYHWRHDQMLD